MDNDLALLILSSCTQCTRDLEDVLHLVKAHAQPEDYEHLKLAIGKSIHQIMFDIEDYVGVRCPGVRAELEARVKKFGRAF
ncbi:MAG TPA: hypothetical protein VIJ94_04545 [Caulobacteraceae bacterium]